MKQLLIFQFFKINTKKDNLILLISFLLSFFILVFSYTLERKNLKQELGQKTKQYASIIEKEIYVNTKVLNVITSIFKIHPQLTRHEFYDLINPFLKNHTSIQALEWIPQVPSSKRTSYELQAQETFSNFSFKEKINGKMLSSQSKNTYYPVYYVEPYLGNEEALGYDLSSSPIRLDTLKRAKESKQVLATSKITLVQSPSKQAGFLVFAPIFHYYSKEFIGFALGVFKIEDIVNYALKEHTIDFVQLTDQNNEMLMKKGDENTFTSLSTQINVLDRKWTIEIGFNYSIVQTYSISILILLFTLLFNFLLIYLNISKRKENLKLIQFNNQLQIKVDKAIESAHKKDILMLQQSRLAQMGELLSMIAHQWRQPLSIISSISIEIQLKLQMKELDLKVNNADIESYIINRLQDINICVQDLSTTIDDFRGFYKTNKEFVQSNYKHAIEKSLLIIKDSLLSDTIKIIYNYDALENIIMNVNELKQVILNLLKNAQDSFNEFPVKNPTITITTNKNILHLHNNGKTIPTEIIDKIFDPYFSTKKEKNGTGLGLYMSKIIVDKHHKGLLSVQNNDTGVLFMIQIGLNKLP